MLHGKTAFRIAWVSPDGHSCRPLLDRVSSFCEDIGCSLDVSEAETLVPERCCDRDRIVLVAPNRARLPSSGSRLVDNLDQRGAMGSRNGELVHREPTQRSRRGYHWQQPWFRWWDSWGAWFFPEFVRPGSVLATAFSPVVTPLDYATPSNAPQLPCGHSRLTILCSCRQTASMLRQQATHAGWSALVYRSINDFLADGPRATEGIVWDDSVLASLPGVELNASVDELMDRLTQAAPATRLIASIGLENLYLWPTLQKWSGCEVLVKPSHALALSNCLFAREYLAKRCGSPS